MAAGLVNEIASPVSIEKKVKSAKKKVSYTEIDNE